MAPRQLVRVTDLAEVGFRLRPAETDEISWYLDYIIHGAYEHQLPDSHIDCLMDFESLVDPDSTRHARNRRIIDR